MKTLEHFEFASCGRIIQCDLTQSEVDGFEETNYTTYGTLFKDETGNILWDFRDISTNCTFVKEFIDLCAKHEVADVHIADILEDYLV